MTMRVYVYVLSFLMNAISPVLPGGVLTHCVIIEFELFHESKRTPLHTALKGFLSFVFTFVVLR